MANMYKEYFEEIALGIAPLKPTVLLIYTDDAFILRPHQEAVQYHVNSVRPVAAAVGRSQTGP